MVPISIHVNLFHGFYIYTCNMVPISKKSNMVSKKSNMDIGTMLHVYICYRFSACIYTYIYVKYLRTQCIKMYRYRYPILACRAIC